MAKKVIREASKGYPNSCAGYVSDNRGNALRFDDEADAERHMENNPASLRRDEYDYIVEDA